MDLVDSFTRSFFVTWASDITSFLATQTVTHHSSLTRHRRGKRLCRSPAAVSTADSRHHQTFILVSDAAGAHATFPWRVAARRSERSGESRSGAPRAAAPSVGVSSSSTPGAAPGATADGPRSPCWRCTGSLRAARRAGRTRRRWRRRRRRSRLVVSTPASRPAPRRRSDVLPPPLHRQ